MGGLAFGMLANNPFFGGWYGFGMYPMYGGVNFGGFANPFPSIFGGGGYYSSMTTSLMPTTFGNAGFPSVNFTEVGNIIWDTYTNPESDYNKRVREMYKQMEEQAKNNNSNKQQNSSQTNYTFSSFYPQMISNPFGSFWGQYFPAKQTEEKKGYTEEKEEVKDEKKASNEDKNISYDAKKLKNKWSKKQPQLTDQFYSRVVEISQKIKCDPEHLMAIMNLETRRTFSPSERNNKSSTKATGLIQFTRKTAPTLGTTIDELAKMTAIEQLDYVEKYLVRCKKSAGYKDDEVLTSGDLYALIFQPANAKKDYLAKAGTKAYSDNKLLDVNNDKFITKNDLSEALIPFMA